MGVPTSEVGYTSAMPRREDHEVRKGHVGHWIKKKVGKKRPSIHLCVLRGSQSKQGLFLYNGITGWFLLLRQTVFTARYELGL